LQKESIILKQVAAVAMEKQNPQKSSEQNP